MVDARVEVITLSDSSPATPAPLPLPRVRPREDAREDACEESLSGPKAHALEPPEVISLDSSSDSDFMESRCRLQSGVQTKTKRSI